MTANVDEPLLRADGVSALFKVRHRDSMLGGRQILRAVDDVTLEIGRNETVGLVGESGSGKSTFGRGILRIEPFSQGQVVFDGQDLNEMPSSGLRRIRRDMQMIFQNPYSSLDPSMVIGESVAEPLLVHQQMTRAERREQAVQALQRVYLQAHHLDRYPNEFSGGQRQRIAIARAIITNPKLIVADEAVSALDVSTQSQIMNLFLELQNDLGLAALFIAHDLALVRRISQRIAVMYLGKLVEVGPAKRVWERPAHPYTAALLSAIPYPHPRVQRERSRIVLPKELPNPIDPPSGCRFHTRCPSVMDVCRVVMPTPTPVDGGGHVSCHLQTEGPKLEGEPLPWPTASRPRTG